MIAYRKLVPVYPSVHLAIMACEDCDEVQIVHPAARAVEQIRATVDVVKYRSDRGGQRALLLHPAQLSRGAIHALVKTGGEARARAHRLRQRRAAGDPRGAPEVGVTMIAENSLLGRVFALAGDATPAPPEPLLKEGNDHD